MQEFVKNKFNYKTRTKPVTNNSRRHVITIIECNIKTNKNPKQQMNGNSRQSKKLYIKKNNNNAQNVQKQYINNRYNKLF